MAAIYFDPFLAPKMTQNYQILWVRSKLGLFSGPFWGSQTLQIRSATIADLQNDPKPARTQLRVNLEAFRSPN